MGKWRHFVGLVAAERFWMFVLKGWADVVLLGDLRSGRLCEAGRLAHTTNLRLRLWVQQDVQDYQGVFGEHLIETPVK